MPLPTTTVVLLHNPHCSKSRATKALLEDRGIAFSERDYLGEPLSVQELGDLRVRLGRPVQEWVRRGEAAYAQLGLGPGSSEQELLEAMAEHPLLMERPIVVHGEEARLGRPPAAVLELFEAD